jgi:hypothetical protein
MSINLPPPPKKLNPKGEPPTKIETKNNLSKPDSTKTVALNFRVPATFKRDFKIAAASHSITQSDLLQQAFEEWRKRHG